MASEHDPAAFKAKLQAWRTEGMNVFSYSYGGGCKKDYHELPSVYQRDRDHRAEMDRAGISYERA